MPICNTQNLRKTLNVLIVIIIQSSYKINKNVIVGIQYAKVKDIAKRDDIDNYS